MPDQRIATAGRLTAGLLAFGIASAIAEVDPASPGDPASAEPTSRPIETTPAPAKPTAEDDRQPLAVPPSNRQPVPLGLCDGS